MKTLLAISIAVTGCGADNTCAVDECSPAADCVEAACSCPNGFIPAEPMFSSVLVRRDIAQLPGLTTAAGLLTRDMKLDGLLVAYDLPNVPIDRDIDLETVSPKVARVGFGYEIEALTSIRAGYLATSGTLRLTSACDGGVAGVLTNVMAIEVDLFADFAPVPGGCGLAVPSVTFAISPCATGGGQ